MDVVVTGGHGAIGRFVVEECISRGHDVTVFDIEDDEEQRASFGYDYEKGDVTNAEAVESCLDGSDAVVHLAALKRPACNDRPKLAQEVNIGGTVNVFEAVVGTDTRVIQVSSKSVFGQASGPYAYPRYEALDEGTPKQSVGDIYGLTKTATESYRQVYVREHQIDAASFRFASSYGPGKVAVPGKGMLIPELIEGAPRGQKITLPGGDEQNDWIYFGDIANGLVDAVEAPQMNYPVYHVGTGRLNSLSDFATILREGCPDAEITVEAGLNPQNKDHPLYAKMDISRAQSDLGYEPEYTLRDGIQEYLNRIGAEHELA
jgi:UDP-glucose 4-epimerase